MDYSAINGTPIYPTSRRAAGRNSPHHGTLAPNYCAREIAHEPSRPVSYQKHVRTSDPKYVHAHMSPPPAHSVQRQPTTCSARRTTALRPEQESYYENYYSSPSPPPPGRSSAYQTLRQNPADSGVRMREPADERLYRGIEEDEEEEEIEEVETVVLDYADQEPQEQRHHRSHDYYSVAPTTETSYYDPYTAKTHRRGSKSSARSYDIMQPTSDGTLPTRPKSPGQFARQQISEPLHNRSMQSKPGKVSARNYYEPDTRHYTRSLSPEKDFYEGRRSPDYRHLAKQQREQLLEELRQQREGEDLKQIFPTTEDPALRNVADSETSKCPLSPQECLDLATQEEEYLSKLQQMFEQESNDVEKLFLAKKAELERRGPRNKSPVTF